MRPLSFSQRYLLALALFGFALALSIFLLPSEAGLTYLAFIPGVVICAMLCGWLPSLLYTAAAVLAGVVRLGSPHFALSPNELLQIAVFAAAALLIIAATELFRRRTMVTGTHDVRQLNTALAARAEELELRLQLAVRASNIGVWDLDLRTNNLYLSPEYKAQLGYTDDEMANSSDEWASRLHPDDRDAQLQYAQVFLAAPAGDYKTEFRLRHRDGDYRWILSRGKVLLDADGKPCRILGANVDVTEIHRIQQALDDAVDRLELTAELAKVGGWETDLRTGQALWPVQTCRLLDIDPPVTPATSEQRMVFINPDARPLFEAAAKAALENDTPWDLELPATTAKGRAIWVRMIGRTQKEGGKAVKMVGSFQDITDRKFIEQQIVREKIEKEALINSTNDIIWSIDHEIRLVAANQTFFKLTHEYYGVNLQRGDELLGPGLFPPEATVFWKALYDKALSGTPLQQDLYIPPLGQAPGSWLDLNMNPVYVDGRITGVACFGRVITERKVAEAALLSSRQFALAMANHIPGTLGYWTAELRCEFANDGFFTWFGLTPEQTLGKHVQEILGEELFRKNEPHIRAVLRGENQQFERQLTTHAGEVRSCWIQYAAYRVDGAVRGFFVLVTDITSLKQTERELRESEMRYTSLVSAMAEGVALNDATGAVIAWNQSAERILGLSGDELRGIKASDPRWRVIQEDGSPLPPEKFANVVAVNTGLPQTNLIAGVHKPDGTLTWISINAVPIFQPGETFPSSSVVSFTDITARKQAESALREKSAEHLAMQRQLAQAQKMEAIGQLAGGIAHDFNNILASILGYTELALELKSTDPDSRFHDYLSQVKRAGERASKLVAGMLAFSRKSGGIAQDVPVAETLQEVIQLLRPLVPVTISLHTRIAPDLPNVWINSTSFHQTLMNLLLNARDAISEHGVIEITAQLTAINSTNCTSCGAPLQGGWIVISVRDNGCGMAPDIIQNIFDPFFTTKATGRGTGLGLSMTHGFMHEANGHLHVTSVPGQGTTMQLLLPPHHPDVGQEPDVATTYRHTDL